LEFNKFTIECSDLDIEYNPPIPGKSEIQELVKITSPMSGERRKIVYENGNISMEKYYAAVSY
jgi:hypothetical protein